MHRDFKADPLSLSVYPPFNLLSYLSPMKLSSQTCKRLATNLIVINRSRLLWLRAGLSIEQLEFGLTGLPASGWDDLKKEWKAWKKLKGEDTGLGWNPKKRIVDAPDDWWESRLKVVPEAQKFRTSGNDPEFEGKLDQMFMGIVATSYKAWAPSSGTLLSDFFEDVNNEIPEENEEENVRNDVDILNDVHISNDVQIGGNGQKRKNPEISSSQFKTGRKKSSKQIGGAARLSSQIEKLCNATDNMSQATSSLTPVMDPYGSRSSQSA
ncbi:hypothetical protein GOBAR_AA05484 [Gossypium barbadense]|uniref:Myb/SANT-like domain-containing protein n=1 Tax=Gossypium barbadense TaxID=3634 RepID=A0A2P5YHR7_GOSBA|nr:hypothetical protein GOBAR_AA05484 [Gossypium barbadense]